MTQFDKKPLQKATNRKIGVVDVTRSGKGFLLDPKGDIPIPRDGLGGALSGDIVEVALREGKSEIIGRVVKILERKTSSFVGELVASPTGIVLHADNPRVYFDFHIVGSPGADVGTKVVVDVIDWVLPPKAKVRQVIGPAGEHETEMKAIVLSKGFESDFPKAVLDEAQKLYEKAWDENEVKTRRDFRDILTFTIDPDTAKDFDDAISYQQLLNGDMEIGIHIADVTYFVTPDSILDAEAFKRATSVYLVDRTIPMLPPQLSDDLCSLKPNQDRLVFSAVFTIHKGEIIDRWFGKAIINSKRRFTYDEADETLKNASALLHTELAQVWEYASMVRQKRFDDGAVMFGTDEIKPIVDVLTGEVTSFKRVQYTESHQLIEELMLLANREVATLVSKRLGKKNRVFVYRIHDVPNAEKMEELAIFLRAIGYQLSLGKKASGKDINKLLKQLEGKPEERLIKTATIRSMAKAIYTTKNIGHFGLAFEDYAHFTSPIRRYPDVMVHRTLFTVISGNPVTDNHEAQEKRAVHASEREVAAAEAERGSIKLKQVEFFAKKIGEIRSGVVSGVSEWGLYIADVETATEGMARLTTLTDDTYEHQPKRFAVIGSRSKRVIQMGDPVTYRIEKANIADRTLDFSIIPTQ